MLISLNIQLKHMRRLTFSVNRLVLLGIEGFYRFGWAIQVGPFKLVRGIDSHGKYLQFFAPHHINCVRDSM